MIPYILVSKRPVPVGSLAGHPGARQQLRNFGHIFERKGVSNPPGYIFDYAEEISKLADLPKLEEFLKLAISRDSKVYIDDFRRLFSRCKPANTMQFYEELREYGSHFRDFRTNKVLSEVSQVKMIQILASEKPITFALAKPSKRRRTKIARKKQTKKATAASLIKRTAKADKKAEEIINLKEIMQLNGEPTTVASVTKAANNQGMTTSRGNTWSSTGISRALKRGTERGLAEE